MSNLLNSGQITGVQQFIDSAEDDRGGLGQFNAAFGNSAEAFLGNRKPGRDGKIEANWKDRLFGHSTDELTEEYYKKRETDLARNPEIAKYLYDSGNKIDVTSETGKLLSEAGKYKKAEKARSDLAAQGYNVPSQFKTEEEILTQGAELRKDDPYSAQGTAKYSREQSDLARSDTQRLLANQNTLQMMQFQNQSADRASQRRMDSRRLDLQESRDSRKAQREMMMMIMAGLNNIGQGFQ
jgi:hypothetical protein